MKTNMKILAPVLLVVVQIVLFNPLTFGQNSQTNDVVSFTMRNSGEIVKNNEVVGYYNFILLEKKDRKNNHYLLSIQDENLNLIKSIEMVKPVDYVLMDAAYNNAAFGFLFFEPSKKTVHISSYTNELALAGNTSIPIKSNLAVQMLTYIAQTGDNTQKIFEGVPDRGFLFYGYENEGKLSYSIRFYSNKLVKLWETHSIRNDKYDFETSGLAFISEDYVVSAIAKRTSLFSTDVEMFVLTQDLKDGSTLFDIPSQNDKYKIMFGEMKYNPEKQQWAVIGEYFNKSDNMMKDESLGIISMNLSKNGKIISETYNDWNKIASTVNPENRDLFDKTSISFQKFVSTSDGKVFAIGEQYRKEFSPTTKKIAIYNMIIFEFDENFQITRTEIFNKPKEVVNLPKNMMISNAKMLGLIAKAYGGFGYIFTSISPERNSFTVQFMTNNEKSGKDKRTQVGSIIYSDNKSFSVDKIDLDRNSDKFFIYPAKQGYVMISEYYEKEKRLDRRIVKLNY